MNILKPNWKRKTTTGCQSFVLKLQENSALLKETEILKEKLKVFAEENQNKEIINTDLIWQVF